MFHFDKNKRYEMPVLFGGYDYDAGYEAIARDVVMVTFSQETTTEALEDYLPEGFTLLSPSILFQYFQLREVNFLAGGAYNIVQAAIPVHFEGSRDCLDGVLPLVLWENNTIPILGGRESSGMPKIYADINDLNIHDGTYFSSVSFHGATFLSFEIGNLVPCTSQEFSSLKADYEAVNAIGLRYITKVGAPGADLFQTILYPQSVVPYECFIGTGSMEWTTLPSYMGLLHSNIVAQLSALPCVSMSAPTLIKGAIHMKSLSCRLLD